MEYFVSSIEELINITNKIKTGDFLKYNCICCGKRNKVIFRPERLNNYKKFLCKSCACKKARKDNPDSWKIALETNKRNHDGILACQTEVDRKRSSEDHKNHPEWQKRSFESQRSKRDGLLWCQTDEGKEICRKNINVDYMHCAQKEKYGAYYLATDEGKRKSREKKKEIYGDEFYTNLEKQKKTINKKYGVDNFMETEMFKDAKREYFKLHPELPYYAIKKQKEKYGSMWIQTDNFRIAIEKNPEKYQSKCLNYFGLSFDSIPEFCVYLYCIYHWIPIIRNYSNGFKYTDIRDITHRVYPDFIINRQFVEIKGAHFFKPDGEMYLPYRNPEWTDEEYEYRSSIFTSKHRCLIDNNVIILKDTDPWVQNCINWVNKVINIDLFIKSNIDNLCYGYTPHNIDTDKKYQEPIGLGLTPFDI